MSQFIRQVFNRAQLAPESVGVVWAGALAPKLNDTVTRVELTEPNQLTVYRTSDLSLTAFEMHLLLDWLESPDFPRSFHTFSAPPPAPPEYNQ